jgi:Domain of unknown function (DUF4389)
VKSHPIRLTVEDDLHRSRLTVFFRLLLSIPHFVWLWLWSIAAVFAGIANWLVTLIAGRPPEGLHRFLSAYVRYTTHVLAYVFLAANPYPGFTGSPGYPIDLEVEGPQPQRRVVTAFRLVLAVPVLLVMVAFVGTAGPSGGEYGQSSADASWSAWASGSSGGALLVVAFLGWFAALATTRMPRGFRDLEAYGLRYVAQALAYVLVVTDRYPNADPADPHTTGPDHPVRLAVSDDLRRSRLTVFFRLLLSIPHIVWIVLWSVAVFFAALAAWIVALITGSPPAGLHRFLSAYVRYSQHLSAYVFLTANPFPGFTGAAGSYPVDLELPPPGPQRRVVTLFRLFLALPAFAVSSTLGTLLFVTGFLGWFVALATGRVPHSFREAQAYVLRYSSQAGAYLLLVSDRYPYSGTVLGSPPPAEADSEPGLPPEPAPSVA